MTSLKNFVPKKNFHRNVVDGGFTLIELMVTLSIVILATGLIMVKYVSFNSTVLLNSLAYQIAFDLRKTQSLAISVRGAGGEFREEYGLHFDTSQPNQYILFQDADSTQSSQSINGIRYDEGEAIGSPIIIDPRFTITSICATGRAGRNCNVPWATVAFARPDFDAIMWGDNEGLLSSLEIILGTDDGSSDITRTVIVTSSGQITVK